MDVVFVHGIRGGPFVTWRRERPPVAVLPQPGLPAAAAAAVAVDHEQCWPSTWLAEDLPSARLLSMEYAAPASGWEVSWRFQLTLSIAERNDPWHANKTWNAVSRNNPAFSVAPKGCLPCMLLQYMAMATEVECWWGMVFTCKCVCAGPVSAAVGHSGAAHGPADGCGGRPAAGHLCVPQVRAHSRRIQAFCMSAPCCQSIVPKSGCLHSLSHVTTPDQCSSSLSDIHLVFHSIWYPRCRKPPLDV